MLFRQCFIFLYLIPQTSGAKYLYIPESKSYDEGRQLCSGFGLDLAKVSSGKNIDDLHAMYSKISGSEVAWLGLHYQDPLFYWPDGTVVKYSCWNNVTSNEPDHLATSQCAVVKQSILLWHTRACTNTYPSLCGPYPQSESTSEMRLTSFTKWRTGAAFIADPTSSMEQQPSSRACAKDCLMLQNCMFFSLEDDTCKIYSDITSVLTQNKHTSVIWRRNTITI